MRGAGLLAGIARRISDDEIAGRGDPPLTALLRPCLGGSSPWGGATPRGRRGEDARAEEEITRALNAAVPGDV